MFFAAKLTREVSEWLKELAWKASMWVTASRVRIPSSLQNKCFPEGEHFLLCSVINKKESVMKSGVLFSFLKHYCAISQVHPEF